jgi:hypothetical protein
MGKNLDIQARVRVYYDRDLDRYIFVSAWNNGQHTINRTVTEEQAEVIEDMIMGAHIQVSSTGR